MSALTEKEWAEFGGRRWHIILESETGERVLPATKEAAIALALYQQPFGFTRQDLQTLSDAISFSEVSWNDDALVSLRDRIAALLPPEERAAGVSGEVPASGAR